MKFFSINNNWKLNLLTSTSSQNSRLHLVTTPKSKANTEVKHLVNTKRKTIIKDFFLNLIKLSKWIKKNLEILRVLQIQSSKMINFYPPNHIYRRYKLHLSEAKSLDCNSWPGADVAARPEICQKNLMIAPGVHLKSRVYAPANFYKLGPPHLLQTWIVHSAILRLLVASKKFNLYCLYVCFWG